MKNLISMLLSVMFVLAATQFAAAQQLDAASLTLKEIGGGGGGVAQLRDVPCGLRIPGMVVPFCGSGIGIVPIKQLTTATMLK